MFDVSTTLALFGIDGPFYLVFIPAGSMVLMLLGLLVHAFYEGTSSSPAGFRDQLNMLDKPRPTRQVTPNIVQDREANISSPATKSRVVHQSPQVQKSKSSETDTSGMQFRVLD